LIKPSRNGFSVTRNENKDSTKMSVFVTQSVQLDLVFCLFCALFCLIFLRLP